MRYIKDFFSVQKETFKNTFKNIKYLPILMVMIIAYQLVNNIIGGIINTLQINGYLASILRYLIQISMISLILNALYTIVKSSNLLTNFIRDSSSEFIIKILEIGFILYLIKLIIRLISPSLLYLLDNEIIILIIVIIFSALPESIYLEDYNAVGTLEYSLKFSLKNIYNWNIPNFIFYYIIYKFNFVSIFSLNIQRDYFSDNIINIIIKLIILSFILIYRGHLFETLSRSSLRKREFQSKL